MKDVIRMRPRGRFAGLDRETEDHYYEILRVNAMHFICCISYQLGFGGSPSERRITA